MRETFALLQTIAPNETHRCNYESAGDWWITPNNEIHVTSIKYSDRRSTFAILIHELVEAELCREKGITDEAVCAHDIMFEQERADGKHSNDAEPGDDPRACYLEQHRAATAIEKVVCDAMGLDWEEHEDAVHF